LCGTYHLHQKNWKGTLSLKICNGKSRGLICSCQSRNFVGGLVVWAFGCDWRWRGREWTVKAINKVHEYLSCFIWLQKIYFLVWCFAYPRFLVDTWWKWKI
jgi:hypothetical protein